VVFAVSSSIFPSWSKVICANAQYFPWTLKFAHLKTFIVPPLTALEGKK
jgi:hypothetical protein